VKVKGTGDKAHLGVLQTLSEEPEGVRRGGKFAEDWSEKNEVFAYFNLNFNCCRGGWINNAISIILKNNNGKGPAKLLIFEYNM